MAHFLDGTDGTALRSQGSVFFDMIGDDDIDHALMLSGALFGQQVDDVCPMSCFAGRDKDFWPVNFYSRFLWGAW